MPSLKEGLGEEIVVLFKEGGSASTLRWSILIKEENVS
jgi:hypothetical protein